MMASRVVRVFLNHANSYHGKHIVRELVRATEDGEANYEICGSLVDLEVADVQPLDASCLEVLEPGAGDFFDRVTACDVIVYDVNGSHSQIEEACQVLATLRKSFEISLGGQPQKFFVLISTILSWQATEPVAGVLTDKDYRKRRPHPCFQLHLRLEQQVMVFQNRFEEFIKTVVLCPGVGYGAGEDTFHYLFKSAYQNLDEAQIYEPGDQVIPMIHVKDFAKCVANVIDQWPDPKIRYILAVQPESLKLCRFAESVIREIGGTDTRTRCLAKEAIPKMSQKVYLKLTLNLNLRSTYFEEFEFENSRPDLAILGKQLAREYYECRNLGPIKVVIHGPPLSGKSALASNLAAHYGVHVVTLPGIFEEIRSELQFRVERAENYLQQAVNLTDDPEEELCLFETLERVIAAVEKWKLDIEILKNLQTKDDELSDFEIKFLRNLLESMPYSQNQGYVMDGFTYKRKFAERLFLAKGGEGLNSMTKPDLVIILTANDEVLCNSAMDIVEEVEFSRKMEVYRDASQEDESLFNFFLDHEVLPVEFNVDETTPDEMFEKVKAVLGEPQRYPRPRDEIEAERRQKERAERERLKTETKEKVAKLKNLLDDREKRVKKWACRKIQVKREEIDQLEMQGLPARNYLAEQVLPCITEALLEVVRVRPADPIDFLAEQLLKQHSIGQQILKSQNLN